MDPVHIRLQKARLERRMSLSDVADATFIDISFLERIERGELSFLPRPYVRAFLRDYAKVVGLDPDELMETWDANEAAPPSEQSGRESPLPQTVVQDAGPGTPARKPLPFGLLAFASVVALVAAVALWNLLGVDTPPPVRETPFDRVLREQSPPPAPDSEAMRAPAHGTDTLVLAATPSDTVWVQISADDGPPMDYVLRPGRTRTWKAARRFLVSVGNAGAVRWTLDGGDLGKLGSDGSILRNVEVTRTSLRRR
ncbi:MAG: RodZ domain-containing protein [Bacteroidota bacterium]